MTADNPIFIQIEALLDGALTLPLDELEDTLTSGYAAALALEAERWRIERRIAEVAGAVGDGAERATSGEIAKLARRLTSADADVRRLRTMLATLRDRAEATRAA